MSTGQNKKMLTKTIHNKPLMKKLGFTLIMLIIFEIGSNIPIPGINKALLQAIFAGENVGLFDLFNMFSGGSFQRFTLFTLSVAPYITASIIVQLLGFSFGYFERLSEQGDSGRRKQARITRWLAFALSLVQAAGLTLGLFKQAVVSQSVLNFAMIIIILTTSSMFLVWIGEQITEYGIGNGMSILIFAGIISGFPVNIASVYALYKSKTISVITLVLIVIVAVLVVAFVNYVQQGVRKVPIYYAQRGFSSNGNEHHIPIKLVTAGVIPIIFSLSLIQLPVTIAFFVPHSKYAEFCTKYLTTSGDPGIWIYIGVSAVLTIAFTYFYSFVVFKPEDISKSLAYGNGVVPGIRQGKDTEAYLHEVMKNLCLPCSIFLVLVALLPTVVAHFTPINMTFGGTSILIMISVALDTIDRVKAENNFADVSIRGKNSRFL